MNKLMKNFFLIITILMFFYPKVVFSFNEISSKDCYQKISYPSKMFGQFQSKTNKSIREIQRIFVFGKNKFIKYWQHLLLFGILILMLCFSIMWITGFQALSPLFIPLLVAIYLRILLLLYRYYYVELYD